MRVNSKIDVHNVSANVEQAGRTSDKIIGFGPIGIGLDGVLTWVPGVGELYTLGAGAYLLTQGGRARVPGIVLMQMGALILTDFVLGAVPIAGDIPDMLFCAHLWAGGLLRRAINKTAYVERGRDTDRRIDEAMAKGQRVVLIGQN